MIKKHKKKKQYLDLIDAIKVEKSYNVDALINRLQEINSPEIEDIWFDEVAISYWVFVSNNIFSNKEIDFVKQLLFWREVYGKSNARVKCLISSENRYYNLLIKELKISSVPALIISNTPDFEKVIILGWEQINKIDNNGLISYFNGFHRHILAEEDFDKLNGDFNGKQELDLIDIVSLKELISQNKVEMALLKLSEVLTSDNDNFNDFILIKSEIKRIETNKRQGTMHEQEYSQSRSKLVNSLINFIDDWNVKYG